MSVPLNIQYIPGPFFGKCQVMYWVNARPYTHYVRTNFQWMSSPIFHENWHFPSMMPGLLISKCQVMYSVNDKPGCFQWMPDPIFSESHANFWIKVTNVAFYSEVSDNTFITVHVCLLVLTCSFIVFYLFIYLFFFFFKFLRKYGSTVHVICQLHMSNHPQFS